MSAWIGLLVVGAVIALLLWQWRILRLARRSEGQRVELGEVEAAGKTIYYFYSESCGACRSMTPRIQALVERYPGLHKIDVQADPQTAQQFKVRATPTTVLVRDGVIERVFLGARSQQSLEDWLQA